MVRAESHERTQRTLGVWGLFALGTAAALAIIGIVMVSLLPTKGLETGSDALTALASIGAGAVGALAGWLARGQGSVPSVIEAEPGGSSPPGG
jgi:hypothetical protein